MHSHWNNIGHERQQICIGLFIYDCLTKLSRALLYTVEW